jgi:hypothetical protein
VSTLSPILIHFMAQCERIGLLKGDGLKAWEVEVRARIPVCSLGVSHSQAGTLCCLFLFVCFMVCALWTHAPRACV